MTTPNAHANPPGQQLAAPAKAPATLQSILQAEKNQQKLREAVSGGLDPARFVRLCIATLQKNPKLGECDPYSVFGAMMTAASLGLEPNTPLGHAYLIPYKGGRYEKQPNGKDLWVTTYECQFQIGYRGFVKLMYESPLLVEMQAEAVHKNDKFQHKQGTNTMLEYEKELEDRGPLKAAFCYIKIARAGNEHVGQAMMVLPLDEIKKIRGKSQTYVTLSAAVKAAGNDEAKKAKAQAKLDATPWVEWEDDMAAKSAIKKMVKQLSISPRVSAAAAIDDAAETGKLDLAAMGDLSTVKDAAESGSAPLLEHDDEQPLGNLASTATGQPMAEAVTVSAGKGADKPAAAAAATTPAAKAAEQPQQAETTPVQPVAAPAKPVDFGE